MTTYLRCVLCGVLKSELDASSARQGILFGLAVGGVKHKLCPTHATEVWHVEEALRAKLAGAAPRVRLTVIDGGLRP